MAVELELANIEVMSDNFYGDDEVKERIFANLELGDEESKKTQSSFKKRVTFALDNDKEKDSKTQQKLEEFKESAIALDKRNEIDRMIDEEALRFGIIKTRTRFL